MAQPEETFIRFVCPKCRTQYKMPASQAGARQLCARCRSILEVPGGGPSATHAEEEGYLLVEKVVPESDEIAPPFRSRFSEGKRSPRLPKLPRRPFLDGTFNFPFLSGSRAYMTVLAFWAIIFLVLAEESGYLGSLNEGHAFFICAMFCAFSILLCVTWCTFASACGLAIIRDGANGDYKVFNWPGPVFVDWMLDPLYMFNALCISALPGAGLGWLLSGSGYFWLALSPAGMFFFFPIVLLSLLETGSPFGAVSLPVWKTLFRSALAWGKFYLISALLIVAAAFAASLFSGITYLGSATAGIMLTFAWFVYFRLLGRLAWYCSEHSTVDIAENDQEDEKGEELEELTIL
jgi:hypothetical protein